MINRRDVLNAALAFALGLAAFASPARALEADAASQLVRKAADEVVALLASGQPDDAKEKQLRSVLRKYVGVRKAAQIALGRPYNDMSDGQKAAYEDAYIIYVARRYFPTFSQYTDETIEIIDAREASRGDISVKSRLTGSGAPEDTAVDWRVSDRDGAARIVDISFEGVTLSNQLRTDFTALYEQAGRNPDAFIAKLKTP